MILKKFILIVMFISGYTNNSFSETNILTIIKNCQNNETLTKQYLKSIEEKQDLSAKEISHKAVLLSLMAKHAFLPTSKMQFLNKSTKAYQEAVNKDPNDIEIRFLRFNTQTNLPSILKDKDLIKTDKKLLIAYLSSHKKSNQFLNLAIKESLLKSKDVTKDENELINKIN